MHPSIQSLIDDMRSLGIGEGDMATGIIDGAVRIALNPNDYKVCEQCDFILPKDKAFCRCRSYRFHNRVEEGLDVLTEDLPGLKALIAWAKGRLLKRKQNGKVPPSGIERKGEPPTR